MFISFFGEPISNWDFLSYLICLKSLIFSNIFLNVLLTFAVNENLSLGYSAFLSIDPAFYVLIG